MLDFLKAYNLRANIANQSIHKQVPFYQVGLTPRKVFLGLKPCESEAFIHQVMQSLSFATNSFDSFRYGPCSPSISEMGMVTFTVLKGLL